MRGKAARFLVLALVLALAFGCAAGVEEEDQGLKLWFPVNPALDKVSEALGSCAYQGEAETVPGLLSALLAGPGADGPELIPLVPDGTRVLSWSLEDRVASVELSAAYAELAGVDLTLADYCVTLTLTQLESVDGVRITVNGGGQSYRDRRVLYPEDVLFSGAEEAPVELSAALYFRREGGSSLGFEWRKFRLTQDKAPVREVLDALIAGPEDTGLLPLLPAGLTVRSVRMEDGMCIADLSAQLLDVPEEDRALAVNSIVETLCSLDAVDQAQVFVEGEPIADDSAPEGPSARIDHQITN